MNKELEAIARVKKDYLNYLENTGYIIDGELSDLQLIEQALKEKQELEIVNKNLKSKVEYWK